MAASAVFPFMAGGAADGTTLPSGAVALSDLTACPRFGLKGGGSAAWLTAHGIALPALNRIGVYRGMRILRRRSHWRRHKQARGNCRPKPNLDHPRLFRPYFNL